MEVKMFNKNKLFVFLVLVLSTLLVPGVAFAQTNLEPGVCVSVYGGGVVCGAKHEVVDTALGDINPGLIAVVFMVLGYGTLVLAKKVQV